MDFIKGVTFSPFSPRKSLDSKEAKNSLENLIKGTGANYITLVPNSLQDHAQSEEIDYFSDATYSDDELIRCIQTIHKAGLKIILKPTVNCKNGTWRAHINFFDKDVPCEPKWSNWFASYTKFQMHFAEIAEKTNCEMFIPGCEMVMSERRSDDWRKLIQNLRTVYHGLISYNTDKYQEDNIDWWDCVDVISSSGYYPPDRWKQELDRIEAVVRKFNKPFFFAECGCMSVDGASKAPNDWRVRGAVNLEEQKNWYISLFKACEDRPWIQGFCLWDWCGKQYPLSKASQDTGYSIYGKPAQDIVRINYTNL